MGVRPDAPTIETIVWVTFYELIKNRALRIGRGDPQIRRIYDKNCF
jgi:hypothetical protein